MSGRLRKPLSLAGLDLADLGEAQLTDFAEHYLLNGMHGVSFSGYEDGQTLKMTWSARKCIAVYRSLHPM